MTDYPDFSGLLGPADLRRRIGEGLARAAAFRAQDHPCPTPRLEPAGNVLSPATRSGLLGQHDLTRPSITQISSSRMSEVGERFDKNLKNLKAVAQGRVLPETEDLSIGEARKLKGVAVLFLDICRFSSINSGDEGSQDQVFSMLSLFMAEMLHVVRSFEGKFEKNTGDGLMAYFGESPEADNAKRAVQAAVTMHCWNDYVISPRLKNNGLPKVKFRVGIETGMVSIARIGVRGDHNSLVAVGNVPNVACKLMNLLHEKDGIVIGHHTRNVLPYDWQSHTKKIENLANFSICGTSEPYPAYELTYRAPDPNGQFPFGNLLADAMSSLGGKGGLSGS